MKKLLALLMVIVMCLSVCACGESEKTNKADDKNSASQKDDKLETELTSQTWYDISCVDKENELAGRVDFKKDGTGHFKNYTEVLDFTWEIKGEKVLMDMDGIDVEYTLSNNNDRYELTDIAGERLFVKESDAKTTIADATIGSEVELGLYEQDNIEEDGKEPIRWYVADNKNIEGYVVLVSVYGLDYQQYHNEKTDVTWETCSLRTWLNDDFYNSAFSEEEKSVVSAVKLENPENSYYRIPGGNDTTDKVYLLNEYDATNYLAITAKHHGQALATEYTQALGAEEIESYWLRSPGDKQSTAAVAYGESNFGETYSEVTNMRMVRPVILVPKNTEVFVSYIA